MRFFNALFGKKRRVYLDHAAATPVRPEVLRVMRPYFCDDFGNPSAVHHEGVVARRAIEDARLLLARTLRVRARDVTFTASGTESNNLALIGHAEALRADGRAYGDIEIISTRIEHPSILGTLEALEAQGVHVRYADVDEDGLIKEQSLRDLLSNKTALITFAYANSEIGVVHDANRLSRIAKAFAVEHGIDIVVHLDASQASLWLPCQLDALGADMMTLDAGKCGGPKGVGVLVHRKDVPLVSVVHGGEQEKGLRSGTENVAGIVGAVSAIEHAQADWHSRSEATASLRDHFIDSLLDAIPSAVINGSREQRIANNVNISIPGLDTEYAVIWLDTKGIACSTQSACSGKDGGLSPVVLAVTDDNSRSRSTIRFTLGQDTTKNDLAYTLEQLKEHVTKYQQH